MMLSQFLLGLQEGLGTRLRAKAADLARAIRSGFDRLHASLDEPVEGGRVGRFLSGRGRNKRMTRAL